MATLPNITAPPASPSPSDGANFASRAYSFLAWVYSTFGAELASWVASFNAATAAVNSSITSAANSASTASTAATTASAALTQMVAAVNGSSIYPPQLVTSFYDPTAALPGSPVAGRAYVSSATANGWTINRIYKYSGSAWAEYTPPTDWLVLDVSGPAYWRWDGTTWDRRVTAFDVSVGTGPGQVPAWSLLGTAAALDITLLGPKSVSWDASSCASGSQVSTTASIPGAEMGDRVYVTCGTALSGLMLRGEVTAQDTVTLYLYNPTGSTVDLTSAIYYVTIWQLTPRR